MVARHSTKPAVARLDNLRREALALTEAARHYFDGEAPQDRRSATPLVRAHISCECMRVSARLTQVLSWLMTRRAVLAGELSAAEARRPGQRLGMAAICMAENPSGDQSLPPRLCELLRQSRSLYLRTARLDALLDAPRSMPELHACLMRHAKAAGRRERKVS